jgi:Amt family ammonium transporter
MNTTSTLLVLISSALVFFMVCGLALFYAGLVPARNAVNTMKMNFFTMAVIPLIWIFIGYTLAFSGSNGFIGNFDDIFFNHLRGAIDDETHVSKLAIAIFQMMFAVIAAALISGAVVERMKFNAFIIFIILWSIFVYSVVVHWVWSDNGWLHSLGVIDFAGGYAIHICAGFSALVLAIVVKPRKYLSESSQHNIPFVVLGACILWFGYFGFNTGSAMGVNDIALISFINTAIGASTAIIAWIIMDLITKKNILTINISIAAVIGLVSITPGAGFIDIDHAFFTSAITAIICHFTFYQFGKFKNKIDDSLDVFVCHGLSGLIGTILVGVFASAEINAGIQNGLILGNYHLLIKQSLAAILIAAYAMLVSYMIIKIMCLFMDIRVTDEEEMIGLDLTQHGESAYDNIGSKNDMSKKYSMNIAQKRKSKANMAKLLRRY